MRLRPRGRAPVVGPVGDGVEGLDQGLSLRREGVLHAHGCFRDDRPLHDPFGFQLAQAVAEHAVGDVGDGVAQGGEAAARLQEKKDDRPGPPPPDELDGLVEARAELRAVFDVLPHVRQNATPAGGIPSDYVLYSGYEK